MKLDSLFPSSKVFQGIVKECLQLVNKNPDDGTNQESGNYINNMIRFEIPGVTDELSKFPIAIPLQDSATEIHEKDPVFIIQPTSLFTTYFYLKMNYQNWFGSHAQFNQFIMKGPYETNQNPKFINIITMDTKPGEEKIIINNKNNTNTITVDATEGKEQVIFDNDKSTNVVTLDSTDGAEKITVDNNKGTNVIEMDGIVPSIKMHNKNDNDIIMDPSGIKLTDCNGNMIEMGKSGINIVSPGIINEQAGPAINQNAGVINLNC